MPVDKEQAYSDEGKWKREGRQEIKPAKFLKEFVHPRILAKFKDHEIADFATKFKAFEASQMLEFKVVDVADVYVANNFFREETFGSCMMDKPVGDFYSCFNVSAVAAVRKSGEWVGRALLWNEVKSEGETHSLLDRIYSRNVEITELFLQWAKANNHWVKVGQNNNSFEFKRPDDTVFSGQSYVKALKDISDQQFFPYMDTFAASDHDDESILFNSDAGVITYRNTNGTRDNEDEEDTVVTINGDRIPEVEAVLVGGNYYHREDDCIVASDYTGDYLHIDDAVYSDDSGDWFPEYCVSNGTLVICQDDQQYYRPSSRAIVQTNDGEYYLKDSDSIVWSASLHEHILADGAVEVDGDYYPETSTDIIFCEEEKKYILRDKSNDPPPLVKKSTDDLLKYKTLMVNNLSNFNLLNGYSNSMRTLQGTWTFESDDGNW
jgi:hypothetical protein